MIRYHLLSIFLILTVISCSPRPEAVSLAELFCDCCDETLYSGLSDTEKKERLAWCGELYAQAFEQYLDSLTDGKSGRVAGTRLARQSNKYLSRNCRSYLTLRQMLSEKRTMAPALLANTKMCQNLIPGNTFRIIGIMDTTLLSYSSDRIISVNTKYLDTTIIQMTWLDNCSYQGEVVYVSGPSMKKQLGSESTVRIINITGDTVHFETDTGFGSFPQRMVKEEAR